jgi:molybdopterin-guanine dinucleotide biosynthesis protein A
MSAALYGLLLCGGESRRMQRDKAALDYGGASALERSWALLAPVVERAWVSVRDDQSLDAARAAHPCLPDLLPGRGPISGIHAALHAHPQAAWLVLAVDLPFLDAGTLQQLIAQRDPQRVATAYRSSHDGLPEPLCAIYEPAARASIDAWVAADRRCPRKFLAQADVQLLALARADALDNITTAAEYDAARARLAQAAPGPVAARTLHVQYFALLREQAGRDGESLQSTAASAHALYAELAGRRGLTLLPAQLRVAVNEEFAEWERALVAGDRVAFLPPVAGG